MNATNLTQTEILRVIPWQPVKTYQAITHALVLMGIKVIALFSLNFTNWWIELYFCFRKWILLY